MSRADGFEVVEAVEMDPAAAATYKANHPSVDVRCTTIEDWLDQGAAPQIDVIVGGPPCQGFSALNKAGADDFRNELWREYATTIERTRPRYFIVENVATFVKSPQFGLFHTETSGRGRLKDYTFQAQVLNAADYGAYQARKRSVLIGHHRDLDFPGWPTETHVGRHRTVREAFREIPTEVTGNDLPNRQTQFMGRTFPGTFKTFELHTGRDYSDLSLERFAWIPAGGNRFNLPDRLKAPCWLKHTTGSGDVMGRLHWDRPSVTIRTEFFKPEKGRYLHPVADRAITHREAAILQGFDEGHLWIGSKTEIARQIGNAVPLPLGEALGRALLRTLYSQAAA
jgi:DNA (cytosine-5)-methyltransferase 1